MILDAKKIIFYIPCYVPFLFSLPLQAGLVFQMDRGENLKILITKFQLHISLFLVKAKAQKQQQKKHIIWRLIQFFPLVWQRCIFIGTLGNASDTAST